MLLANLLSVTRVVAGRVKI